MAVLPSSQPRRPDIGFLCGQQIERVFTWLLYAAVVLLIALSVLGTFYGAQATSAPLSKPMEMWADISSDPLVLVWAVIAQFVLTLAQYGARQFARKDRRWWLLYVLALAISIYFNVQAYWEPLTAMLPWLLVAFLLLIGDIAPEFVAVRD